MSVRLKKQQGDPTAVLESGQEETGRGDLREIPMNLRVQLWWTM